MTDKEKKYVEIKEMSDEQKVLMWVCVIFQGILGIWMLLIALLG